jgi:hypothetical protein
MSTSNLKPDKELFRDGDWSLHPVATSAGMTLYVWHRACHNSPPRDPQYVGNIDQVRKSSQDMPNYWCGWLVSDAEPICYRCGRRVPVNMQGLAILQASNMKEL